MALIIFPKLDKKSLTIIALVVIGCLDYLVNILIKGIAPFSSKYFDQICQFLFFAPFLIYNTIKRKPKAKEVKKLLNNIYPKVIFTKKNYFIFIIIVIFDLIVNVTYVLYDEELKLTYFNFNRLNIQMILILLFSKLYSNLIYYKHRLICQFIIAILTSIIDVFIVIKRKDEFDFSFINITVYLLTTIIDTIVISYKHYLFEIKFFSVELVSFLFGILNFSFMTILIIIRNFFEKFLCLNKNKCPDFINFEYRTLKDWIIIVASFSLNSIFFLIYYKYIKEFTPNHLILTYFIYIYFSNVSILYGEKHKAVILSIFILIFIIIFICFLVYLEIMELNFCGLNQYTRRNILKREKEEDMEIYADNEEPKEIKEQSNERTSNMEISEGYFCDINSKNDEI